MGSTHPFHRGHDSYKAFIHSCARHAWAGLDMLLSSTADFAGMSGVTSGLLKQIPPVTRVEAVVWGFPTAGVDVRGGFITDNEKRVELLVVTDGKVTIGT